MTHVVVGANGFLGSALARSLVRGGERVVAVVNRGREHLPDGVAATFDAGDLAAVAAACEPGATVHVTAAFVPTEPGERSDARLFTSNALLPWRVAEAFPEGRLVLASSVAVYGGGNRTIRVDSAFVGPCAYGRSKLAGEAAVAHHRNAAIVRFGSLYGPGMRRETFLPRIVRCALEDGEIVVFGDGSREQDYLHVDDAVELALRVAASPHGGVFLGVTGESWTNLRAAEIVAAAVPGCRVSLAGEDDSPSYRYEAVRARELLEFVPCVTLEDGLSDMVRRAA